MSSKKQVKTLPASIINKIKREKEEELKRKQQIEDQKRIEQEERIKREELLKEKNELKKVKLKENKKKKEIERENQKKQLIIERLNMNKTIVHENVKIDVEEKNYHLRSPITCVLGHVDTGKTTLLDKIRNSNVQNNEFKGITQQIGVTFIPQDDNFDFPGILILDTPGHGAFMNMRQRGTSICDIAILVVDISQGIEEQTEKCIELLKEQKLPFVVALNKFDLIQNPEYKMKEISLAFAERGFNAFAFDKNPNVRNNLSLIPVSAKTGHGIKELLYTVCNLTQSLLKKRLSVTNELNCFIMEVKKINGIGKVLDCILIDGEIHKKDKIVMAGINGPIHTTIKTIYVPGSMKEMRTTHDYNIQDCVRASRAVRIVTKEMNDVIPGTTIYNEHSSDKINSNFNLELDAYGVHVAAPTIGSLESLCSFLRESNIKIGSYSYGNIKRKDFISASVALKHDPNYACILAFDVKVPEKNDFPEIQIFESKSIFNLKDMFLEFQSKISQEKKEENKDHFIWPCALEILPECIFNRKNPLVFGVRVIRGTLFINTPVVCIREKDNLFLGKVTSIQKNKKDVEKAFTEDEVAVKIENDICYEFNNHFDERNQIVSFIDRKSIDYLKEFYRDQLKKKDVELIKELKVLLFIS